MTTSLSTNFTSNIQNKLNLYENPSKITLEQIYDQYASVIYGVISDLTDNVTVTDTIFTDTFLKIRDCMSDFNVNGNMYPNLMRFVHGFATQQLIHYGINPKHNSTKEENKIMYWFHTRCKSLEEVASSLKISNHEVMRKMRKEYLEMIQ